MSLRLFIATAVVLLAAALFLVPWPWKLLRPEFVNSPSGVGAPTVFLVGDSTMLHYFRPLRAELRDAAELFIPLRWSAQSAWRHWREPEAVWVNAASCANVERQLETWLGRKHFDLAVFNCGLHDLANIGEADRPEHKRLMAAYGERVKRIAERLAVAAGRVMFVNSTPVQRIRSTLPPVKSEVLNAIAFGALHGSSTVVFDAHAAVLAQEGEFLEADGLHLNAQASAALARDLAAAIRVQIAELAAGRSDAAQR